MKVVVTNPRPKSSRQLYFEPPIPFRTAEKASDTDEEHTPGVTAHDVRYDPDNDHSATYKVYLCPFQSGTPEETLEFLTKLKLIMRGNGLTTGPRQFNLIRSLLKGEALRIFNVRAQQLGAETVPHATLSLQAVVSHMFPNNPLRRQRRHLRYETKWKRTDTVRSFMTRWNELNDLLPQFPPFQGRVQKISDDDACEAIFSYIPQSWRTRMLADQWDPMDHSFQELQEELEQIELVIQLEECQHQELQERKEDTGKKTETSSKNKHKRDEKTRDTSPKTTNHPCMLHGTYDHTSENCNVLRAQAKHMCLSWQSHSPEQCEADCRKKCQNMNKKNTPGQDEINQMVAKAAKELFEIHFNKKKHKSRKRDRFIHESDESNESDSENEHELHEHEELPFTVDDVNVRDLNALSDLRQPRHKKAKTHHPAPITTASVNDRLGKPRLRKVKVLLDTGSTGSIILEKHCKHLRLRNDRSTQWLTKGGIFNTTKRCKTEFILDEFFTNKVIEWDLHVDTSEGPHRYDMLIGRDLLSELGIQFDFKSHTMTWDDSTINMKDPDILSCLTMPENDFYWHKEALESQALNDATSRIKKILDAKYEPANLEKIMRDCKHLTEDEQASLLALLCKFESLFDGMLGIWHDKPYNIELKPDATPYHARPFPVPKIHEATFKLELDRLEKAGVLKKINQSEWAAPTFLIPKKDGTVHFISDF